MNAAVVSSQNNQLRLKRIKKVCRVLQFCVCIYFFAPLFVIAFNLNGVHLANGTISIFNHAYAKSENIPNAMFVLSGAGLLAYFLGVSAFLRLLNLYEKGIFFAAANVEQIKKLSTCMAAYGLLAIVANVIYAGGIVFPLVLLDGQASPWLVAGAAVYVVAWIMDEGRKIQEEQELTV
jgi:Protein of unknown function (DUF2975)